MIALDPAGNAVVVRCAPDCAIKAGLTDSRQKADEFQVGQLVAFDVEPGAAFEPIAP